MTNTEEKLVLLISEYKELYDTGCAEYSNQRLKDNSWSEIAEEMNLTVTACKEKWKKLRDCFRKAIKARKLKSGTSAKKFRPWKLEKEMAFILPFFDERLQISDLGKTSDDEAKEDIKKYDIEDDTTQYEALEVNSFLETSMHSPSPSTSSLSLSKPKIVKPYRIQSSNVAGELEKYFTSRKDEKITAKEDSLASFFLSMADTVRTLPLRLQVEVKSKVFQIVNEAELAALGPPP